MNQHEEQGHLDKICELENELSAAQAEIETLREALHTGELIANGLKCAACGCCPTCGADPEAAGRQQAEIERLEEIEQAARAYKDAFEGEDNAFDAYCKLCVTLTKEKS